ncbi:hypothetical protein [Corallococcus terminator]|nr:hypothetical protein [Corallococcus terminator]
MRLTMELDTFNGPRVLLVFRAVVGHRYVPSVLVDRSALYVQGDYRKSVLRVEPSDWCTEVVTAAKQEGAPILGELRHYVVPSDDGVWELLAKDCTLHSLGVVPSG